MNIKGEKLKALGQALGYAVMYAKTESETAEFALLKLEVDNEIIKEVELKKLQDEHDKMGCIFMYCASSPKCQGKCKHSIN